MVEIIVSCILFLVAAVAFIISVRSFCEKGFLFNNAYLYADKWERQRMDKKPHYRQSAVVFLLLGVIFALLGLEILLHAYWLFGVVAAVVVLTVVYAIVSSVRIGKRKGARG